MIEKIKRVFFSKALPWHLLAGPFFFFMPPTAYVNQVAMPTAGQNDHYCHIANLTVFTSNR